VLIIMPRSGSPELCRFAKAPDRVLSPRANTDDADRPSTACFAEDAFVSHEERDLPGHRASRRVGAGDRRKYRYHAAFRWPSKRRRIEQSSRYLTFYFPVESGLPPLLGSSSRGPQDRCPGESSEGVPALRTISG